ncbi:Uncharacterised protein [Vibrio cholerae]|nr:Uncharacterised protein [Vibrio cholerae]
MFSFSGSGVPTNAAACKRSLKLARVTKDTPI